MIALARIDPATGEILGTIAVSEDPRQPNYIEIPDGLDPRAHWWSGSEFVAYSEAGKVRYAARPGGLFRWSPVDESWVDDRSLEQAKVDSWAQILARREEAFAAVAISSAGIPYSIARDKTNLAERLSSLESAIKVGLADESTTATWSNTYPLTIAGYHLLAAEMGARGQAIFEHSWALDTAVQGAASIADISEIDLEAGWP